MGITYLLMMQPGSRNQVRKYNLSLTLSILLRGVNELLLELELEKDVIRSSFYKRGLLDYCYLHSQDKEKE